jgi:cytoskeletal protein RodZ
MPSIGPTLRDARIRARIDMAEVEQRTKIRAKYLRAIENEEWDALPGPVYVKSFLRTYGDYLGLDSRMLVEEFKHRYEHPGEHELHPIPSLPRRERERQRERERERAGRPRFAPPPWLAIVVVLALVVAALAVVGSFSGTKSASTNPSAGLHAGTHHKPHAATTRTNTTTTTATRHKFRKVTLQLTPTGPVYICVINGAGKKVIPGVIYDPGQAVPTETARELYLTLGNPSVQMKVNGKAVTVPQSATPIGYRIRQRGTSLLAPTSQPFSCA